MNQPLPTEDLKTSVLRTALEPLGRIFRNEVSFLLVVMLLAMGWCMYWLAGKAEEFARNEIPKHIAAINSGHKEVADDFTAKLKDRDEAFSAELQAQREHYAELRKSDREEMDRIERLASGKKTAATAPVGSSEAN